MEEFNSLHCYSLPFLPHNRSSVLITRPKNLHSRQWSPQVSIHLKLLRRELSILRELLLRLIVLIQQTVNHSPAEIRPEIFGILLRQLMSILQPRNHRLPFPTLVHEQRILEKSLERQRVHR
ncbi:unnamed protein product [Linum tenue]|uniref:Uncharacterized protein n=1 Tax=Linum tenue TaxID=586396 RepID=A0AAV0NIN2_9ROSI|nr:unnamed protein product [Linum tenue]